jgi:chromosome partitioning protein
MKIALIAKKGGVGKTTLCILLHEAIKQTGQTVAVRDYDAQGSASKALEKISGTRETPGTASHVLLIDTPPSLTLPATAAAVIDAQVILIPTSPSPLDMWEAEEAAAFAKAKNPKAAIRIVLNRTRAKTVLTEAAPGNLEKLSAEILPTTLADRQSYQHALLGGWAALDSKAQTELFQFTIAVTSLR